MLLFRGEFSLDIALLSSLTNEIGQNGIHIRLGYLGQLSGKNGVLVGWIGINRCVAPPAGPCFIYTDLEENVISLPIIVFPPS